MQIRNIKEEKKRLREHFKSLRRGYSKEEKRELDSSVLRRVTGLYQYRDADTVLTYVSKELETDTIMLIEKAWSDGKRVAVPKCIDGTRLMAFYYITGMDMLEVSSFGVLEPKTDECELMEKAPEMSICIVPGMSFDCEGYRLGYGKGYYDRFLSEYKGVTVGICYSDCIRWRLPRGRYDKPVDLLITDKFLRKIKKQNP